MTGRLAALAGVTALAAAALLALVFALGPGDALPSSPSTRSVQVGLGDPGGPLDMATGFTAGRGRVVTVAHLLDGRAGDPLRVRDRDGPWRAARVLERDRRNDLALLAVPGLRAADLRIRAADLGIGQAGDRLWLLAGREQPATVRVRRAIRATLSGLGGAATQRRRALELEASVSAGSSGAPVVTAAGEVAGVVFARSLRRAGTAYATGAGALRALLARAPGSGP